MTINRPIQPGDKLSLDATEIEGSINELVRKAGGESADNKSEAFASGGDRAADSRTHAAAQPSAK